MRDLQTIYTKIETTVYLIVDYSITKIKKKKNARSVPTSPESDV